MARFAPKLHIKKGDKVRVLAGVNKGQEGEVKEVFSAKNRAIVEGKGIKLSKKHTKPTQDEAGGINEIGAPIHISNLMVIDSKGNATRIGRKEVDGKMVRYSKKSGEII